jgi:uncharacterized iron-regulated protein
VLSPIVRPSAPAWCPRSAVGATLLLLLIASASCASPRFPAPRRAPAGDPGPLAGRWLLPFRIVDTRTRTLTTEDTLLDAMVAARVVYVGEQHDDAHDHAVQGRILGALARRDPSLAVGMEMFKRPFQGAVDDYVAGRIDEATLLERSEWSRRWGHDFALYRPLLEHARALRLPVLALNAPDEVTRAAARGGMGAIDPAARAALPDLDLADRSHRAAFDRAMAEHGGVHAAHGSGDLYLAQVIWDETMAEGVAAALAQVGGPGRVLVFAGGGHVRRRSAVPGRAARRGASPFMVVEPVTLGRDGGGLDALLADTDADFLWVMAEDEGDLEGLDLRP